MPTTMAHKMVSMLLRLDAEYAEVHAMYYVLSCLLDNVLLRHRRSVHWLAFSRITDYSAINLAKRQQTSGGADPPPG